jgi:hypothetical protein
MVVSCHVVAGNWTQDLWTVSALNLSWAISPAQPYTNRDSPASASYLLGLKARDPFLALLDLLLFTCMCMHPQKTEEGFRSPGAGVIGGCEAWVLWANFVPLESRRAVSALNCLAITPAPFPTLPPLFHVCTSAMSCGGQRTAFWSQFSPTLGLWGWISGCQVWWQTPIYVCGSHFRILRYPNSLSFLFPPVSNRERHKTRTQGGALAMDPVCSLSLWCVIVKHFKRMEKLTGWPWTLEPPGSCLQMLRWRTFATRPDSMYTLTSIYGFAPLFGLSDALHVIRVWFLRFSMSQLVGKGCRLTWEKKEEKGNWMGTSHQHCWGKGGWDMAPLLEHWPSMCSALGSMPSTSYNHTQWHLLAKVVLKA